MEIKSSGTKNAITIVHVQPEELIRLAYDFERLRMSAPIGTDHVSHKLSDTVMLVARTEREISPDPYLECR